MEVRGLNSVGPSAPISRTSAATPAGSPVSTGPVAPRDEVEISAVGRMLDSASRTDGVRELRLTQIRAAIEAGTYDTPEKLEIALDRMLEQIGNEPG